MPAKIPLPDDDLLEMDAKGTLTAKDSKEREDIREHDAFGAAKSEGRKTV